jgi:hypothetical protein
LVRKWRPFRCSKGELKRRAKSCCFRSMFSARRVLLRFGGRDQFWVAGAVSLGLFALLISSVSMPL